MYGESGGMPVGFVVVYLVMVALIIVGMWKLFAKADKPGWAALVPIYNLIVMLEMAGKPLWWIVLCVIPGVNIVVSILMIIGLAKNFGRGTGTVVGLILLPMVFLMILGFGSATYERVEG